MASIHLDVWLYGALAVYGGAPAEASFAQVDLALPAGSSMADLLAHLKLPSAERGITFINGRLSALPGRQPDLAHVLHDQDRIGLFDLRSMWPFQYRHGAALAEELAESFQENQGMHHMAPAKTDPP
jgi:hypothetical protein